MKDLQKDLSSVSNITVNYLDRTQGIKSGTLFTISPTFKHKMMDKETLGANGKWTYESSDAKPFDCANILLINRYQRDGEWIEEEVPAFAINLKATEQPDENKVRYYTMLFRGTSIQRLTAELIDSHKNGTDLNRAKAFYSIIDSNMLTASNFLEHLSEGGAIEFAQYKRGRNMNFVDIKYYKEKIEDSVDNSDI